MTPPVWAWPDSTITRIIDGDSLVARVHRDLGFHGTATFDVRLRLNRINTPPINTDAGQRALTQAKLLMPLDATVLIETVGPYKYGDEWMAEITTAARLNVSDALVDSGDAVYWDGRGPRPGG